MGVGYGWEAKGRFWHRERATVFSCHIPVPRIYLKYMYITVVSFDLKCQSGSYMLKHSWEELA